MSKLDICPLTLAEANAFVEQYHRHHGPVQGHKFSLGLAAGERIVGVAIVGRPVARHLDDGMTLEVTRCRPPAPEQPETPPCPLPNTN
ncbi:XF1762 family protein [Pseudomonas aeruginosa]|uniref:XF1762 family protein n=1 Tax=Pseudomonas aeruginosa TaxID=287 RepID=UPI00301C2F1A